MDFLKLLQIFKKSSNIFTEKIHNKGIHRVQTHVVQQHDLPQVLYYPICNTLRINMIIGFSTNFRKAKNKYLHIYEKFCLLNLGRCWKETPTFTSSPFYCVLFSTVNMSSRMFCDTATVSSSMHGAFRCFSCPQK